LTNKRNNNPASVIILQSGAQGFSQPFGSQDKVGELPSSRPCRAHAHKKPIGISTNRFFKQT